MGLTGEILIIYRVVRLGAHRLLKPLFRLHADFRHLGRLKSIQPEFGDLLLLVNR